jgi:hypothetical protein
MIGLAIGCALIGLGCGLAVKGPFASAWWRSKATIAEARTEALEVELTIARQIAAAGGERYLRRLARCRGCVTCNPEPRGPGDPDYDTKLIGDLP